MLLFFNFINQKGVDKRVFTDTSSLSKKKRKEITIKKMWWGAEYSRVEDKG